jgi:hypothetical protein
MRMQEDYRRREENNEKISWDFTGFPKHMTKT